MIKDFGRPGFPGVSLAPASRCCIPALRVLRKTLVVLVTYSMFG